MYPKKYAIQGLFNTWKLKKMNLKIQLQVLLMKNAMIILRAIINDRQIDKLIDMILYYKNHSKNNNSTYKILLKNNIKKYF